MFFIKNLCLLSILVFAKTQEDIDHSVYRRGILPVSTSEAECAKYAKMIRKCDFEPIYERGLIPARPKEFPHMALIGFGNKHPISWNCAGSLISERYVLTAAHCVSSRHMGVPKWIRLGDLNTETNEDNAQPQDFAIEKITVHPDYKSPIAYNDIALIRLDKDVPLTAYIRPACLQHKDFQSPNLINSAWGNIQQFESPNPNLMKVTLQEYKAEECNATYGRGGRKLRKGIVGDIQLCAGSPDANNDICQGSAGSPLQIYHPRFQCMYNIVGISSLGMGCGIPNIPSVYTRLFSYVSWIEKIVWESGQ